MIKFDASTSLNQCAVVRDISMKKTCRGTGLTDECVGNLTTPNSCQDQMDTHRLHRFYLSQCCSSYIRGTASTR